MVAGKARVHRVRRGAVRLAPVQGLWLLMVCMPIGSIAGVAQADTDQLEHGSIENRLRVVVEAVNRPREDRESALLRAAEREARRMLGWYQRPEQTDEATRELNAAYTTGLVRLLGESGDRRLIPLLVEYSFMTSYATRALVDFGELAVPELLRVVDETEDPLSRRGGAIGVLAEIARRSRVGLSVELSEVSQERIAALAEGLVGSRFAPGYVGSIARLVIATGRADLRKELEVLAGDRSAWMRRGITEESLILLGQRIINYELTRASPKEPDTPATIPSSRQPQ